MMYGDIHRTTFGGFVLLIQIAFYAAALWAEGYHHPICHVPTE